MFQPSEAFWSLIELAKANTEPKGASADPAVLKAVISAKEKDEIRLFAQEFKQALIELNRWDVWGVGYVASGGMGDDAFHYFRSWIIGHGREAYRTALHSPDDLVDYMLEDDPLDNEGLEYIPLDFFTDEDDPRDEIRGSADDDPKGKEWSEEEVELMFPRAAAYCPY